MTPSVIIGDAGENEDQRRDNEPERMKPMGQ